MLFGHAEECMPLSEIFHDGTEHLGFVDCSYNGRKHAREFCFLRCQIG
ncbi:MAG: hypothetical protein K0R61_285 [Microvirga sp.]|nr:hypothetical protein [Microvirga sp.]